MALEQKLHLKLSQKLIMTPSLQQAIKLLQLSKLELQEVLNQELLENPLLEETAEEAKAEETPAEEAEAKSETEEAPKVETKEKEKDSFDEIDYDAYFQDYIEYGYNPRGMGEEHEEFPIENTLTRPPNLSDHLTWQLSMSDASPRTKEIAQFIIGNIDEDGYLRASDEEIMASGGYPADEVEKAVSAVQSLDPIGVGARDLRECLLLQLHFLELDAPLVDVIVRDHWDEFMQRKFVPLAKTLGIDLKTLESVVELIKHLDPKPGRKYSNERAIYVEPDVYVHKVSDEYVIVLNEDGMPKLRINGGYRAMLNSMDSKSDGETVNYIKDKIRSAVWLIKSLDQRQRTIYKVAESIVKHQREFLERGIDFLRPLVLRDVADDIQMHESTVSRVVSNKYMHTPRGLFLMKYFFHSGIDSDTGEDISSLTVKKKIQGYIENEDPRKPLSDSKIMKILNDEGINIARRTVAKYRDELNIPSSTDRKQIF
ncbi:MAG: RNA polymerase factor sigma-54 [Acidobacteria bacterium]|nr:RNA polymerase factor sigma-54 [Acidobacteriota bacterium]MBV9474607.1 RNA polymerase factor sigma-54 [Acidobacteriota bacterium]